MTMCGRTHDVTDKEMAEFLAYFEALGWKNPYREMRRRYNVPPSMGQEVMIQTDAGYELRPMFWGLIPRWSKDAKGIANARGETVHEKASFKDAFRKRRGVMLVGGFYEWDPNTKKPKQPYWIRPKVGGVLPLAAIWETWTRPDDGQPIDTCAIITTTPNAAMAPTHHHRMPVVLSRDDIPRWLDPSTAIPELQAMLRPDPTDQLIATPVSTYVNSPANDSRECWAAVTL